MASLERSDVEAALAAKGFVRQDRAHRHYLLHVAGRYTGIATMVSTGTGYKTIGSPLVSAMAKQVKLTAKQFCELVECTLSGAAYVEILRAKGLLE